MAGLTLTDLFWWSGHILLALLLIVGLRHKTFPKYLFFFIYLTAELATSLTAYWVYVHHPEFYLPFYWYIRFISAAVGYGVTWEIYRQTLSEYRGAAKISRGLVTTFFVALLFVALVTAFTEGAGAWTRSVIGFEQRLRTVQGILIALLLALVWYYAIPLGRNLWGLTAGYAFFLGISIIALSLRAALGEPFQLWWRYLQQAGYLVTLGIWVVTLWRYCPNPRPEASVRLDADYDVFAARTLRVLTKARNSVVRVFQS